jgi:hypothetical protein
MKRFGLFYFMIMLALSGCSSPLGDDGAGENDGSMAQNDGWDGLSAAVTSTQVISLRDMEGSKYVCAENGGSSSLVANRTAAGLWEQFALVNNLDGTVSLRSLANNRYVCAENGGSLPLIANRTEIGAWEKFYVVLNSDGTVSFRSVANNLYVCVEKKDGSQVLIANRPAIGPWEKFYQTAERYNPAKKKWTALVYMAGDNNLSGFTPGEIGEMMNAGSSADLNIVVLWDDGATRHGYYLVEKNNLVPLLELDPNVNMGNPATATLFIDYSIYYFPAEKYFFTYWNHGSGPDRSVQEPAMKGVCGDDNNDMLTDVEQRSIFTYFTGRIGKPVDIVGFAACSMGSAEIAYQYYGLADYMVACESLSYSAVWDFNFLTEAVRNPDITAAQLAAKVVDYWEAYESRSPNEADAIIAVYALRYMYYVRNFMDDFCITAMNSGIPASKFRDLKYLATSFPAHYIATDLSGYMNQVIASPDMSAELKTKAAMVNRCVSLVMSKEWHSPFFGDKVCGMAIVISPDTAVYQQSQFSIDSRWNEFLQFMFPN